MMRTIVGMCAVALLGLTACGGTTKTVTRTVTTTPTTSMVAPGDQQPTTPRSATRRPAQVATAPPQPASPFTHCDQNVRARTATTTCRFAENVFYEYWTYWHGDSSGVVAYSPATHRNYTMTCHEGITVICKAGDGGEVRFSMASVERYRASQAVYYAAHADTGPLCHGEPCDTGSSSEQKSNPATSPSDSSAPVSVPDTTDTPTYSDPPGFCDTHACIPNYPNGHGSIVQCADGTYSHSGGIQGACSHHGGVG